MMLASGTLSARIARTRLAWPMALLMAGATAFVACAVPAAIVEAGVSALGITPLTARAVPFEAGQRAVLAVLAALLSGVAVWVLFDRLDRPARPPRADADAEIDLFAPETGPQLRKSDSHPDAPARRPLFASSDLGTPMDDVDRGPTPFGRPPLFPDAPPAEPVPPVEDNAPGVADTAPGVEDAGPADVLELDMVYEAVAPSPVGAEPAADDQPAAVEPDEESIADRMLRLERGMARRGGTGAVPRPDPEQGLRDALAALRGAATRH